MGQYWRIVNIDKGQQLGNWGKLGECFFDSSPNTLVDWLAVPFPTTNPSTRVDSFGQPSMAGDWAGDRIICVGDYVKDVPEGVLSDDETREFAELTRRAEEGGESDDEEEEGEQRSMGHINLHSVAGAYFERPRDQYFSKQGFTRDQVYVLRNLTKHEYVRADAVNLYRDEMIGPFLPGSASGYRPGLGQVLLSRISWSTDSSASMSYDYRGVGITRGAWAGDRFDIRIIDTVVSDSGDADQWKDISKEVAEEIFAIYTAERGENWRKAGRKNLESQKSFSDLEFE